MYSLRFVAVLSLFLTSIECQSKEMCDFLKPDGRYQGMDIMNVNRKGVGYYMFNRNGTEWQFNISGDHSELYLLPGEYHKVNETVIKLFSIYFDRPIVMNSADCYVEQNNISSVHCVHKSGTHLTAFSPLLNRETIIFLGYTNFGNPTHYTVFLNKQDKNRFCLVTETSLEIKFDVCTNGFRCPYTNYIDQMDSSLLSRLDGVVDYVLNDKSSGIVLLFNIDGRPMFCFHSYGKNISEDCQSKDHLRPIHEECFTDVSDDSIDPLYYVLFGEVILAAILIVASLVMIDVRRRLFESRQSTTNDLSVESTSNQ